MSLSIACLNGQTVSQSQTNEAAIKNAIFVVAAFACVATEKGPKAESKRLFDAALDTGDEIIQLFKTSDER